MVESPAHFFSKVRVIELIKLNYPHYQVSDPLNEYPIHRICNGVYMRWKLDVHAIYWSCLNCRMWHDRVAVEIDTPRQGHGTRITNSHDRVRDQFLAENDGIRTVRLNTNYVWPVRRMPDKVILAELKLLEPV